MQMCDNWGKAAIARGGRDKKNQNGGQKPRFCGVRTKYHIFRGSYQPNGPFFWPFFSAGCLAIARKKTWTKALFYFWAISEIYFFKIRQRTPCSPAEAECRRCRTHMVTWGAHWSVVVPTFVSRSLVRSSGRCYPRSWTVYAGDAVVPRRTLKKKSAACWGSGHISLAVPLQHLPNRLPVKQLHNDDPWLIHF